MRFDDGKDKSGRGFLARLARDKRANVMVIGTAALIPLAGMVGGGLDLSRMYITKTRLQHACDAGVLAGRRTMGGGSWAFNNNAANAEAVRFFEGNWQAGSYGATNEVKSFTESNGVVKGTASVQLPMSLMRIFGQTNRTISVECDAEMRLLNTDVMFVLDTTGSMNQTISGDSRNKMANLQIAVKCFYQILAQLDIPDQDCEGDEPTGGVGPDVQLRFGFVPYSVNVNVGKLLPTGFVANSWPYQTREFQNRHEWTAWQTYSYEYANSSDACPTPANTAKREYQATKFQFQGRTACDYQSRDLRPVWRYGRINKDVSGLKQGDNWNPSFTFRTMDIGNDLEDEDLTWDGCIEERDTVRAANYQPIPAGARDLDIDLVPNAGTPGTQWGPVLPQFTFYRNVTTDWNQITADESPSTINRYHRTIRSYFCPRESRRLRTYQAAGDPANFSAYVDSLTPSGNTYHDIGMIWGQRLLSPTGIFAADNARSATGGAIERHLIFMTDGDTQAGPFDTNAYGLPWFDRRQTDPTNAPTREELEAQIDRRFEALCARGRGPFTIWVIGFGTLSAATVSRLEGCASPGRFFRATSGVEVQQAFREIAEQIGQLRLKQ